jgi:putative methylase
MRQRELEMRLQRLQGFTNPKADLEQYPTPAKIAAEVLYIAHAHGDIEGKSVFDPGCGNAIFSIGACLLGASRVTALDIDRGALDIAAANAGSAGCDIELICAPIEQADGRYDTCIMNPPFGSQTRHADIPFLEKALEVSDVVYSIHNSVTLDFLRKFIAEHGRVLDSERNYKFEIRHTFDFHRKERALFDVTLLRIVRP